MITISLRHSTMLLLALMLAACATKPPAQSEAKPFDRMRTRGDVPFDPERSAGYWPSEPADGSKSAQALPKAFSTDEFSLDSKTDPKAELKQRAIERWAFLIAKRGETAFDYLTPGFRASHDRAKYAADMAARPVRWFRASFDSVNCISETSCQVTLLVDFRVTMSAGVGVTESFAIVHEQWLSTEGVWYHLPPETGG